MSPHVPVTSFNNDHHRTHFHPCFHPLHPTPSLFGSKSLNISNFNCKYFRIILLLYCCCLVAWNSHDLLDKHSGGSQFAGTSWAVLMLVLSGFLTWMLLAGDLTVARQSLTVSRIWQLVGVPQLSLWPLQQASSGLLSWRQHSMSFRWQERASPNVQLPSKPLLVSCLLMSHLPKQVGQPRAESVWGWGRVMYKDIETEGVNHWGLLLQQSTIRIHS